ncbi:uncharacterized protein [Euwallacea fornicatus]|uniref:uncharacterized protein n=1 Tax=Euwallacea fornicatus TaxID=995702 RepID=UPI00338FFAF9
MLPKVPPKVAIGSLFLILLINWICVTLIPTYFIYVMFHVKLSILRLHDYAYYMNEELKRKPNMADLEILKFLNNVVQRHVEIKRFNEYIFNSNKALHFFYICSGCMTVFVGVGLNFGVNYRTHMQGVHPTTPQSFPYYRYTTVNSIIIIASFMYFTIVLTDAAQEYIELGNNLAACINDLQWYEWPVNCQKMYLMMLIQFSMGIEVTLFVHVNVNRQLLKKLYRMVYTILNFAFSAKNQSQ